MHRQPQPKLTLVVDPAVVRRAKAYAALHDTSVSTLVEAFLRNLTAESSTDPGNQPASWPPITRSLFGALGGVLADGKRDDGMADAEALRLAHLSRKYLHDDGLS